MIDDAKKDLNHPYPHLPITKTSISHRFHVFCMCVLFFLVFFVITTPPVLGDIVGYENPAALLTIETVVDHGSNPHPDISACDVGVSVAYNYTEAGQSDISFLGGGEYCTQGEYPLEGVVNVGLPPAKNYAGIGVSVTALLENSDYVVTIGGDCPDIAKYKKDFFKPADNLFFILPGEHKTCRIKATYIDEEPDDGTARSLLTLTTRVDNGGLPQEEWKGVCEATIQLANRTFPGGGVTRCSGPAGDPLLEATVTVGLSDKDYYDDPINLKGELDGYSATYGGDCLSMAGIDGVLLPTSTDIVCDVTFSKPDLGVENPAALLTIETVVDHGSNPHPDISACDVGVSVAYNYTEAGQSDISFLGGGEYCTQGEYPLEGVVNVGLPPAKNYAGIGVSVTALLENSDYVVTIGGDCPDIAKYKKDFFKPADNLFFILPGEHKTCRIKATYIDEEPDDGTARSLLTLTTRVDNGGLPQEEWKGVCEATIQLANRTFPGGGVTRCSGPAGDPLLEATVTVGLSDKDYYDDPINLKGELDGYSATYGGDCLSMAGIDGVLLPTSTDIVCNVTFSKPDLGVENPAALLTIETVVDHGSNPHPDISACDVGVSVAYNYTEAGQSDISFLGGGEYCTQGEYPLEGVVNVGLPPAKNYAGIGVSVTALLENSDYVVTIGGDCPDIAKYKKDFFKPADNLFFILPGEHKTCRIKATYIDEEPDDGTARSLLTLTTRVDNGGLPQEEWKGVCEATIQLANRTFPGGGVTRCSGPAGDPLLEATVTVGLSDKDYYDDPINLKGELDGYSATYGGDCLSMAGIDGVLLPTSTDIVCDVTFSTTGTVPPENQLPVITSTPVTTATEGVLYNYDVDASDPDAGDVLTFSLDVAPAGMNIDPGTGLIAWTPTNAQVGDNAVTVRVTDTDGLFATQSFTVTVANVNDPPTITSTPVTTATEGVLYNYDVDASDPDAGDVLTFSLDVAPAGMSIDPNTGLISWTPTNAQVGDNAVTVRVTDTDGLFATQSFTVTVANVNDPPTITSTPVTTATEGVLYNYDVDASDPDAGDVLTFSLDVAPAGMSIDPGTGLIAWTPTNAQVGDNAVSVRVTDGGGLFDTQSFTVTVANVNDPPEITSTPVTTATEGVLYNYDVDASDPDAGDVLTFSLDVAPAGMNIDPGTGLIAWTPTNAQVGDNPVSVRVTDGGGLFDTQSFTVTVANVNDPPEITSTPVTTATEGVLYNYDVDASDPDAGDVLTFSLDVAPAGMNIDPGTGLIAWTPTNAQVGDNAVTVRVTDTDGLFATQSFTVTVANVNDPPTITSTPVTTATEGVLYNYDVDASDPDAGDVLTFSLDVAPAGMNIDPGTGLIAWTPTNAQVGDNAVTVRVTDTDGLFATQSFTVTVANVNDPPTITSTPVTTATEGVLYNYDVDASDPDAGDVLTFSLDVAPAGMNIDPGTGLIAWTPTNAQVGDNAVTVRVTDTDGLFATQSFTVTVANVNDPPTITSTPVTTATEDVLYNYDVDASDPDAGDVLTYSLDVAPAGMGIDPNTGLIAWTPTNAQVGDNAVTVRVTDGGGLFATQSFTVTVANVNDPPTITSTPVTTATEDVLYNYDVDASDPDAGDVLTYSLDLAPAGMGIDPNTGLIAWTPTNAQVGDNAVTVRVTDGGGLFATQSFTVTVANVNDPPAITSTPVTTATEGVLYNYDVDASDPDAGDVLTFSLDVAPSGMSIDPGTGLISWTPTNAQVGDNAVTVRVTDGGGLFDTQSYTVTVNVPFAQVFVTSQAYYSTEIGSLAGADAKCQQLAVQAGLANPENFIAWLSSSATYPKNRFSRQGPYVLTDGTVIATSWEDLTDGFIAAPISVDESGTNIASAATAEVWSGTSSTGLPASGSNFCYDWRPEGGGNSWNGETDKVNSNWSLSVFRGCTGFAAHIYCFEQIGDPVPNQIPEAQFDFYSTPADTPLIGLQVMDNDTLGDEPTLIFDYDAMSLAGGSVVLNPDQTFDYTPPGGFSGEDGFSYTIRDNDGDVSGTSVYIEVTGGGGLSIVVPSEWSNTEAPDLSLISMQGRYQQVFAADDFGPGPIEVTAVTFRPDGPSCLPHSQNLLDVELLLATVPLNPDELSPYFDTNLTSAEDITTVYWGPITLSSSCDGPLGGPMAFDIHVELQMPFFYDPALGNLILQWTSYSGEPVEVPIDAVSFPEDTVSAVGSLDPFSPVGDPITDGVITEFTTAGGGPPSNEKIVFATGGGIHATGYPTPGRYTGEEIGLAGGPDAVCMFHASNAGFSGTFKAWIAGADALQAPFYTFTQSTGSYILPGGVLVAYDWSDLTDGSLVNPIDQDELGAYTGPQSVWTNVDIDGQQYYLSSHCNDWTTNDGSSRTGLTYVTNSSWTSTTTASCGSRNRIFCFEQ